jgi:phospholipid/cholesterol/gamma-HCH transport system substrate-binding protein
MKKISNEVKIGAVAILAILAFIWLFNFLKGKNYFKNTNTYYAVYDEIGGLEESSPVEVNGYQVGVVQVIDFLTPESGRLVVKLSVARGFRLPKNTVAEVLPVSIIAGMKVRFVYGSGPGYYSNGDTIPGRLAVSLISTIEKEIEPVKDKMMKLIGTIDSVTSSINEIMDPAFRNNLKSTLSHLNNASSNIDNILGTKETDLKTAIENLTRFSKMLSDNSSNMSGTLSNLKSISDTLAAADIYKSVSNMKASLEKTSTLLGNLNEGKGSAGKLLTNDSLYINLNNSIASLDELLKDMKANPKRYVHFSLFGKKNIQEK